MKVANFFRFACSDHSLCYVHAPFGLRLSASINCWLTFNEVTLAVLFVFLSPSSPHPLCDKAQKTLKDGISSYVAYS